MTMDRQQWIRRLPWLVSIILLVLLIDVLSRLTWQWLSPEAEIKTAVTGAASSPPVETVNVAQQVARYHLFGRADVVANSATPTVAPETKLNLVLNGVIAAARPEDAVAIIATRGGAENGYSLNARLPGGAELKEIYPERVIIKYQGRLEALTLQRKLLSDKELTIN
jgi:general secretion pathway protein C